MSTMSKFQVGVLPNPGTRSQRIRAECVERCLSKFNERIGGSGIEPIRDVGFDSFWGDVVALYVNRGDSHYATLIYDVQRDRFTRMTVAEWMERRSWLS